MAGVIGKRLSPRILTLLALAALALIGTLFFVIMLSTQRPRGGAMVASSADLMPEAQPVKPVAAGQ